VIAAGLNGLRIVLVDDHRLVRAGLRALVESLGVEVVAEAGDGVEALQLIGQFHPAVALMDISMPGLNGLEAARRVVKEHPSTRVVILSMHADSEYVHQALLAGAAGYLLKTAERAELEMALRSVARGEVWLSPAIGRTVIGQLSRAPHAFERSADSIEQLTPRQREVLQLVAEGHSTKKIAQRLQLSVKTVETHRAQIMNRLDIHTVAGLVLYALRVGVIRP
jgi:DNA-binding NarL/FixJ family response regulator